jgi:hypothetical protein
MSAIYRRWFGWNSEQGSQHLYGRQAAGHFIQRQLVANEKEQCYYVETKISSTQFCDLHKDTQQSFLHDSLPIQQ